jgi:hypothetical protein
VARATRVGGSTWSPQDAGRWMPGAIPYNQ